MAHVREGLEKNREVYLNLSCAMRVGMCVGNSVRADAAVIREPLYSNNGRAGAGHLRISPLPASR